ncbi:helicase C-terminal domain-containing protein [Lactococcus cremoris]
MEGKSLNKLFLSKLPYPVHTDPYIELISQGYSDKETFTNIIEPTMLKKLEQGLGRLIRSTKDFGFIKFLIRASKQGR